MTSTEFSKQWTRLKSAFRLASGVDPKDVQREWFRALEQYQLDAVESGITVVIREAEETFWPALGVLIKAIRIYEPDRVCRPQPTGEVLELAKSIARANQEQAEQDRSWIAQRTQQLIQQGLSESDATFTAGREWVRK